MPYKVTKDGEIICDSAEEAIALAKAMAGGTIPAQQNRDGVHDTDIHSRWTDSRYREFISLLRGHQKPFLDLLLSNPHGKTDRVIRQSLGLESNMALAGVTSGLSKNARKVGMSIEEIFSKRKMNLGDERVLEYSIVDSFRSIAGKVGQSKEK